jgi:hypothetical protein
MGARKPARSTTKTRRIPRNTKVATMGVERQLTGPAPIELKTLVYLRVLRVFVVDL